ncbi:MAG: heparan-alpha-glucosaminide N-acetyltransferase domain-containing protein, partial [Bdellovibrionia bacterium]
NNAVPRFRNIDYMRGLVMAFMAWDHSNFFFSKGGSTVSEMWGGEFPKFDSAGIFFLRLLTLLCAPTFLFLMTTSMILFSHNRRSAGWSKAKITRYFAIRGAILVLLQFFVENPAWNIGFPLALSQVYFGVLYMLGLMMIFCSLILELPSMYLAIMTTAAVLITPWVVPTPDLWNSNISILPRILAIPGQTPQVNVLFAPFPWLGVAGLGLLFGRLLIRVGGKAFSLLLPFGAAALGLFVCLRVLGGHYGSLNLIPIHEWWSFFYTVKYPPSIAYISLTLGLSSLMLYCFYRLEHSRFARWLTPFEILGGSALFFYVAHLFLYAFMGIFMGQKDATLLREAVGWFLGLIILIPMCNKYRQFKYLKPAESVWKMF